MAALAKVLNRRKFPHDLFYSGLGLRCPDGFVGLGCLGAGSSPNLGLTLAPMTAGVAWRGVGKTPI